MTKVCILELYVANVTPYDSMTKVGTLKLYKVNVTPYDSMTQVGVVDFMWLTLHHITI